jgi:hypothetical protein
MLSQIPATVVLGADKTAPALKIATPKNNQTGIAANVKISLKFSENIYKSKYFSKIKLTKSNKAVRITASVSKNYLKIAHKYLLSYSSSYVLSVPAYSIKDKAGNILRKAITIKFKTKAKPKPTPTPTPTPIPTPTPTPAPTETPYLDRAEVYMSVADTTSDWVDYGYIMTIGDTMGMPTRVTGIQRVELDIIPQINMVDGMINFADKDTDVASIDDCPISVRLNDTTGTFDSVDGAMTDTQNSDAIVEYVADTVYHLVMVANMDTKKYSVWVTPDGGNETQIAADYTFRSTASDADDLGKIFFNSKLGNNMQIENAVRFSVYTPGNVYTALNENGGWQDNGLFVGRTNSGMVSIEYDVTPLIDNIGATVDFADSQTQVWGFGDLPIVVQLTLGYFYARNGDAFEKSNDVPCAVANVKFHVEIEADTDAKTYSVWVTPEGGSRTQIAADYGFRTTANDADDLGQLFITTEGDNGNLKVENLQIGPIK